MINHNNLISKLSEPLEEPLEITFDSKKNLRRSARTQTLQILYLGQIPYNFTAISNKFLDTPKH